MVKSKTLRPESGWKLTEISIATKTVGIGSLMRRAAVPALAALMALAAGPAAAAKANWDALGAEFCRLTLAGDLPGLRPLLSNQLARDIEAAAASPQMPPPRVLFQSYSNEVPVCAAKTRNVALVEIRRSNPGGAAPAWSEYLVIVPEADGTSRIDDVLFATRKSDTLRARLAFFATAR